MTKAFLRAGVLFALVSLLSVVAAEAQQADLSVAKLVSTTSPNVGDTITFQIYVANAGPAAVTSVVANDPLPTGLSFVSATASQGSYNSGTGAWTIGSLGVGAKVALTIQATVTGANPIVNTAIVNAPAGVTDPVPANNSSSLTITPRKADLSVAKGVTDTTPNVGDTVTFTVTIVNNGPDAATGVAVSDLLPTGLTFVAATPSQGTYSNTTGMWTVGTMLNATSRTLQMVATVVGANAMTNTASIADSDQFDPAPGNNASSSTVTPLKADLAVVKGVSNSAPAMGSNITFTVALVNNGPDAATSVAVTDLLPTGLTFVSATPSLGAYAPLSGLWSVGTLSSGAKLSLQIVATVVGANAMSNTASVSHSDQFDPNPANNSATSTVTPLKADLSVAKIVNAPQPVPGSQITFTVSITNLGPGTATGVSGTDALPVGLAYVSATPSQGAYNPSSGAWTVGTLANAAAATMQIVATVTGVLKVSNTATATANQADPTPGNNSATVTVTPLFTDSPLVVGTTRVKALHVTELRTRIDAQRSRFGVAAFGWTVPLTAGTIVRAAHVNELRLAVQQVYASIPATAPTFTDPMIAGITLIRALHIQELRNAVIALEGM